MPSTSHHTFTAANSSLELEVARKFRAGIWMPTTWCEFCLGPDFLPESAATASAKSEKSPAKVEQKSHGYSGPSAQQENKKYLLIRTKTSTFFTALDDAVGGIVSEQELAKVLCSQPDSSSSACAREFSTDTLLAACSQLKQSSCFAGRQTCRGTELVSTSS